MEEQCRQCGTTLDPGRKTCPNPECPTNKKTKPICQKCQVVMDEVEESGPVSLYRCPKCGVTSKA